MINTNAADHVPTLHLPDLDFSTFCFNAVPTAALAQIQNVVGRCGLATLTMRWNDTVEWVEGDASLGFIPTAASTSTFTVIAGDEGTWLTYPGPSVSDVLASARFLRTEELTLEAAEAMDHRIVEDLSTGRWEVVPSPGRLHFSYSITPAATTTIPTAALTAIRDCVSTHGSAQLTVTWDELVQRYVMGDPDGMRPDRYSRAVFHVRPDVSQRGSEFTGPPIWSFLAGASAMPLANIRDKASSAIHEAIRIDLAAEEYDHDHWSDDDDTQFYMITSARLSAIVASMAAYERAQPQNSTR